MIAASLNSLPTSTQRISRVTSADDSRFASPPLSPPPRSPVWEAEEETSSPVFTIDTNFDFSEPANKSTADRYTHKNKRSRYRYTQRLRRFADNATLATSLADFKEKVYLISLLFLSDVLFLSCRFACSWIREYAKGKTCIWKYLMTCLRGKTLLIATVKYLTLGNSQRLRVNAKNGHQQTLISGHNNP